MGPRGLNKEADYLSCQMDQDDYMVASPHIPLVEDTFIPAVEHACLFGSGVPTYRVLALKVRFDHSQGDCTTNVRPFI